MDKTVNIEVLLKAAEYIEQSNTGFAPNSSDFFNVNIANKNETDCMLSKLSDSDQITKNKIRIFNNSINNLKQQTNSFNNINKYLNNYAVDHKRSDEDEDDPKMNANRNKTTHNILEKNRRAHLKECFENLQNELPLYKDKKVTNLLILKQTCKYLEQSKKKEKESATEIKKLLAQNITLIEHLNKLKDNFENDYVFNFDVWINQNANKLKEIKMLNYDSTSCDDTNNDHYDEENSKKFDSFESESSEFDSEYNENSKSN